MVLYAAGLLIKNLWIVIELLHVYVSGCFLFSSIILNMRL